ncbi:unnamed protein product [Closterium sp. NIES-64]|nr:unnamed protein product [Closterium sp. NIES-64]
MLYPVGAAGAGAAGGNGVGGAAGAGASKGTGVGALGAGGSAGAGAAAGPVQSQSQLQPASPLPAPSPYTGPTGGLAERREPACRSASPVRAARTSGRGACPRSLTIPCTHQMALRPSTAPLRVHLPSPQESSLRFLADPDTDVLEDRQEELQCFAAALPHLVSTLIAPEGDPDAPDIPILRSYAEAIKGLYSSQ